MASTNSFHVLTPADINDADAPYSDEFPEEVTPPPSKELYNKQFPPLPTPAPTGIPSAPSDAHQAVTDEFSKKIFKAGKLPANMSFRKVKAITGNNDDCKPPLLTSIPFVHPLSADKNPGGTKRRWEGKDVSGPVKRPFKPSTPSQNPPGPSTAPPSNSTQVRAAPTPTQPNQPTAPADIQMAAPSNPPPNTNVAPEASSVPTQPHSIPPPPPNAPTSANTAQGAPPAPNLNQFTFGLPPPPPPADPTPDPYELTPIPFEGYPTIGGVGQEELLYFVSRDIRRIWDLESQVGPVVLAVLANDGLFPPEGAPERIQAIENLLLHHLGPCPDLIIGAPTLKPLNRSITLTYHPAFPFLITGITPNQRDSILERGCWSSPSATVFFHDYNPVPTDYIMTLRGFTRMEATYKYSSIVTSIICDDFRRNFKGAFDRINSHRDNIPSHLSDDDAYDFILDSMIAKGITIVEPDPATKTDVTRVVFNLYIHPHTKDTEEHADFRSNLRNHTFVGLRGSSSAGAPVHCNVCKAYDHQAPHCEYSSLPGWNRPKRLNHTPPLPLILNQTSGGGATRGKGQNPRGTRGRGRGGQAGNNRGRGRASLY